MIKLSSITDYSVLGLRKLGWLISGQGMFEGESTLSSALFLT